MLFVEAFGSQIARRGRRSLFDDGTITATTRVSSAPPTSFVDVPRSKQTKEATMQSPDSDILRPP